MSAAMGPAVFRTRFPSVVSGDVVHLASCSLGPYSSDAVAALSAMGEVAARHGSPWQVWEQQVEQTRLRVAAFLGAQAGQVALVPNATVGAYQVASGLVWWARPRLLVCREEFPSLVHVWLGQQARGAEVVFVNAPGEPVTAEHYLAAIDDQVALVSVPLVTFRDGLRLPVDRIAAAAHAAGAVVLTDAYQAIGVEPVDVTALGCDFLVAGAGKYLCGLPGLAFLYGRDPLALPRQPRLTGWQGQRDPFMLDLTWYADARRWQTGTLAIPAVYAADAALRLLGNLDLAAVRRHVAGLVTYAATKLGEQDEIVSVLRDPDERGAHLAIVDADPAATAKVLAVDRIVLSPRQGVLRLAVHYFTTEADVDAACEVLHRRRVTSAAARPAPALPRP